MRLIKRNYEDKLKQLLDYFPAVVILGARQSGKTTLAKSIYPSWKYIDLESPNDYERLTSDTEFFFKQYPGAVIIDEAQRSPELFEVLRGVIDQDRGQKGRFILTGSASPSLFKQVSETLAGRVAIMELTSLKANEYSEKPLPQFYQNFSQKLDKETLQLPTQSLTADVMHQVWLLGGYPEPLLHKDAAFKQLWFENYRSTYINRDLAWLFPKLNHIAYQRFLGILAKLSCTILNKADIARVVEVDEKTIKEYIEIAKGTYLWGNLPSYEKNITKAVIKMPKGYLRDTGFLHYLYKINDIEQLYEHPTVGSSFESYVIEEIVKGLSATLVTNWQLYYYRTRAGSEIDLIIEGPFGLLPIEIKYGTKVTAKQIKTLTTFVKEHSLPFGLLINQADSIEWLNEHILQLPVTYL